MSGTTAAAAADFVSYGGREETAQITNTVYERKCLPLTEEQARIHTNELIS